MLQEGQNGPFLPQSHEFTSQVTLDGGLAGEAGVEDQAHLTVVDLATTGAVQVDERPANVLLELLPFLAALGVAGDVTGQLGHDHLAVGRFPRCRLFERDGRPLGPAEGEQFVRLLRGNPQQAVDGLLNPANDLVGIHDFIEVSDLHAVPGDEHAGHAVDLHAPSAERQDPLDVQLVAERTVLLGHRGDRAVEAELTLAFHDFLLWFSPSLCSPRVIRWLVYIHNEYYTK